MTRPQEFRAECWLHIYGQYTPHGCATIRGTKRGLAALRDAINTALESGLGEASVFTSDGESYVVGIQRINTIRSLGTPEYISDREYEMGKRELQRSREFRLK